MRHSSFYIKTHILIVAIILSSPVIALGQARLENRKARFYTEIDSLQNQPNNLLLYQKRRNPSSDSLFSYYDQIFSDYKNRFEKLNHSQKIAWLYEIGLIQIDLEQCKLAKKTFEEAVELTLLKFGKNRAFIRLKTEEAFALRQLNQFNESNSTYIEIRELAEIQHDTAEQMHYNYFIAENYENMGEYQKAIVLCQELYNYSFKKGDFVNASYNLVQLGFLSSYLEQDTSYMEYFHMANELALKGNNQFRIGNNLVSTGIAYSSAGYLNTALHYFLHARKFMSYFSDREQIYLLNGLCDTYIKLDSTTLAMKIADQAMYLAKKIDGKNWLKETAELKARCFNQLRQTDSAIFYLQNAIVLNSYSGNKERYAQQYKMLSDIYQQSGNYEAAMIYLDSSYAFYNDFVTYTNEEKLAQLRNESDYYIHKARINELDINNKQTIQQNKKLKNILAAISLILILTAGTVIINRKKVQKRSAEIFKPNHSMSETKADFNNNGEKTHPSKTIKDEQEILKKFNELFFDKELFTNPDLNLKEIADLLNTNTSYLSAIINKHFTRNLKSLINRCRIDKVLAMMSMEEFKHFSLDGLASEAGFKSRTGFYTAFKSVTGVTPTIYMEKLNLITKDENVGNPENNLFTKSASSQTASF